MILHPILKVLYTIDVTTANQWNYILCLYLTVSRSEMVFSKVCVL